jgi:hypothetical protein
MDKTNRTKWVVILLGLCVPGACAHLDYLKVQTPTPYGREQGTHAVWAPSDRLAAGSMRLKLSSVRQVQSLKLAHLYMPTLLHT